MQIKLSHLTFHAHHGLLPQEGVVGGDFEVNLLLDIDDAMCHDALYHDEIAATVNYADVYALTQQVMSRPAALLEHVAARLARLILRSFKAVWQADVSITKLAPPITGFSGAGVTVRYVLHRRLVVWDFDGTLANTARGIVRTAQATFEKVGLPVPDPDDIRRTIGLPIKQAFIELAHEPDPEMLDHVLDTYHELFEQIGVADTELFEGILEAVKSQHEEGFFTAIATSRGHVSVEALATRLGLRPYLDYIVACEDVGTHKPNPEPVLALCRMSNVLPSDTIVIGDTTFDIGMARRAGAARAIGVSWGNHSVDTLRQAGADQVVATAHELTAESLVRTDI